MDALPSTSSPNFDKIMILDCVTVETIVTIMIHLRVHVRKMHVAKVDKA